MIVLIENHPCMEGVDPQQVINWIDQVWFSNHHRFLNLNFFYSDLICLALVRHQFLEDLENSAIFGHR